MRTLLITGASGFLGWNICIHAKALWNVFGTVFSHSASIPGCNTVSLNLTNYADLKNLFNNIKPDAVIHTAAISQPNICQDNPKTSYLINVEASINLSGLCSDLQIPFVFTSTDLVFDGNNPPYSEISPVTPVSIYGEQKVKAENGILSRYPEAAVCRMPLMFGDPSPYNQSFLQSMIMSFQKKKQLRLFTDEFRTLLSGYCASLGLIRAIDSFHGIIHLGGKKSVSRYEFGKKLAEFCNFDKSLIEPLLQKDIAMSAPRPANVSLDSSIAFSNGYSPLELIDELDQLACLRPFKKQ